jgi:hypothetical protein
MINRIVLSAMGLLAGAAVADVHVADAHESLRALRFLEVDDRGLAIILPCRGVARQLRGR